MFKTLAYAATLGLGLVLSPATAQTSPDQALIDWRIVDDRKANTRDEVTLILRRMSGPHGWSNTSRGFPIEMLRGFDPETLNSTQRTLTAFTLSGDAGQLACEGSARDGTGSGECVFAPDNRFGDRLVAMGIERPNEKDLYHLLVAGVSLDDVEKIESWGYGKPDLDDLVAFAVHGVDDDFVQGLRNAGLIPDELDELIAFRIHGVDAAFVSSIRALGPRFDGLEGDDFLAYRIHGVTPEFIREIETYGLDGLEAGDFVAFRIHGVTPDYIDQIRAMGAEFETMTGDEMISFAIHGVNGDDIEAFAALGYTDLSPRTLVEFRIHGVTPAYVSELIENGLPQPDADRLVRMKNSGFDPGRIKDR